MVRPWTRLLVAAAVLWHLLSVLSQAWIEATEEPHGRDFASYYYAVHAAADGADPYDKAALGALARDDGTRRAVHPFFYPPPFLLLMGWVRPLELVTAYRIWFWVDELALWVAGFALWRWWRGLSDVIPAALAVALGGLTAVWDNHLMGQANLPVLALVVLGLWAEDRDRPWLGGALVGAACMLKMSPALFVVWWLARRRFHAAGGAIAAAVALSAASLGLVPFGVQWRFYTEVLPGFGSGEYNGLTVPISLFGNHSVPNLLDTAFPGGGHRLSGAARALSAVVAVAIVGGLAWAFRGGADDAWQRAGQAAAIAVAMLLIPVYTYEHHVVWAVPAVVLAAAALHEGRLGEGFAIPLGLACAAWAFAIAPLKKLALWAGTAGAPLYELKFAALVVFLVAAATIGRRAGPA